MAREAYTVEFLINAQPELIYNYVSTASGLNSWFADDVSVNGVEFTFYWEGSGEIAKVIKNQPNSIVKFQWLEREQDEYLTFQIQKDDLTGDTSLVITDFDEAEELEEAKLMWESVIEQLKGTIGG